MARHSDVRSPSPVGSSHSSSKRHHREGDRYERSGRDDARGHRHRSRSRSPDVKLPWYDRNWKSTDLGMVQRRYRDRDRHHRDRSRDRYREDDYYRSSRRDRSRERRKSRDRDIVKDYRRRSRERDSKSYRDDSRDRARRRREGSADSRRKGRRDDSRNRPAKSTKPEVRLNPTSTNKELFLTCIVARAPPLLPKPTKRGKLKDLLNWRPGSRNRPLRRTGS